MSNTKKNGYDEIKGMLNTIRNLNESKINNKKTIFEQTEIPDDKTSEPTEKEYDNIEVINDVEVKLISPDREDIELKDDEKDAISQVIDTFRQDVSQMAELDPGFTVSETQIRLDGNSNDMDISFVLIAGEQTGLYVTSDMSLVDEGVLTFMTKLGKFYQTFVTAMEPLIRNRKTT
jgi:hypothetical protein